MSNPVNIFDAVTLIFIYDWFNFHKDILVLTRVFCLFITLGLVLSFRFLKIYSGGWRRRFGILLLLFPLHYAICCIILIVLLYMYNSDKCCINNDQSIVNSFMNCLFDYYILSFRCKILCCFISFISFLFLITPITICLFLMVWNRHVYLIVGLNCPKRRVVTVGIRALV